MGLGRSIFFENKAWVVPWARPNAPARMPGCDSIALHFFPHGGGAIRNERESRNGQRGTRTSSVGAPTHWRVSSSLPPCASAHRSVRRRARDSQLPWRPAPFPLCVYAHAVQRSIFRRVLRLPVEKGGGKTEPFHGLLRPDGKNMRESKAWRQLPTRREF